MGNLEEGKLASAQHNMEMPSRCFAQAIPFLKGRKRVQVKAKARVRAQAEAEAEAKAEAARV